MSEQGTDKNKTRSESLAANRERQWNDLFQRLQAFHQKHGHCMVPVNYDQDPPLGTWLALQRQLLQRGVLRERRKKKLDALESEWNRSNRWKGWNEMYEELLQYHAEHGNCLVPRGHKQNPKLAKWVSRQRVIWRQGIMAKERIAKLDAIDFQWNPGNQAQLANAVAEWQKHFNSLVEFHRVNDHCRVPTDHELYHCCLLYTSPSPRD